MCWPALRYTYKVRALTTIRGMVPCTSPTCEHKIYTYSMEGNPRAWQRHRTDCWKAMRVEPIHAFITDLHASQMKAIYSLSRA